MCLFHYARQRRELFFVPGHHDGRGLQQRKVHLFSDRQILVVTRLHALQLQASRWRIKTGMEDRAVGLAGAGQDIAATLQQ
ncbi:hypothetical protein D3C78_1363320 [compost metagenome]